METKLKPLLFPAANDLSVDLKKPRPTPPEPLGPIAPPRIDRIELSSTGKAIAAFQSNNDNAPDVRMELVNKIKLEVESGTYDRPAKEIAAKMINDLILK